MSFTELLTSNLFKLHASLRPRDKEGKKTIGKEKIQRIRLSFDSPVLHFLDYQYVPTGKGTRREGG